MKIIQLPQDTRNFTIEDNVVGTSQVVTLEFMSPFYHEKPVNSNTLLHQLFIANIYLRSGNEKNVLILDGASCVNGRNINENLSPTTKNIMGYYFLWSNDTNYPNFNNFGVVSLNNPIDNYTKQDISRNVVLVWLDVDIWKFGDPDSDYNRQLFYDYMGFDPNDYYRGYEENAQ